jgi:hypothetical protein
MPARHQSGIRPRPPTFIFLNSDKSRRPKSSMSCGRLRSADGRRGTAGSAWAARGAVGIDKKFGHDRVSVSSK